MTAKWTCQRCQKRCRRPREKIEDFITRTGYSKEDVGAHPNRWTLQAAHLNHDPDNPSAVLIALCLSCHRKNDNPQMARIKALERERQGQLTLADIPPESHSGYQLPLLDIAEPYGLENEKVPKEVLNPVELKYWIKRRAALLPTPQARLNFLRQLQPDSCADYAQRQAQLIKGLPRPCTRADLETACKLVLRELIVPRRAYLKHKRHSQKGRASGYIEKRIGNKKRRSPAASYYYKWECADGKVTEYIPVAKLPLIQSLVEKRTPAIEILEALCEGKRKITPLSTKILGRYNQNRLPLFEHLGSDLA